MKKSISLILCLAGFSILQTSFSQGLQVNPPASNSAKTVAIPHGLYPSNFFFSEPQILSIDQNESGDKLLSLQNSGDAKTINITEIKSAKTRAIQYANLKDVSKVFYLNDNLVAIELQSAQHSYDIFDVSTSKVVGTVAANNYIGSTATASFFSIQKGNSASVLKFDLTSKKSMPSILISGEVFGWYFSKLKGIVGVAVHSNMLSNIYSIENEKLGKSLFEFSSGYYFETKGCNAAGDVFYGITNFQSVTTYSCAISKSGLKPLNSKVGESCTDIFLLGNEVALSTNNTNAAENQESQNNSVQKILSFVNQGFKGASIQILDFVEKNNSILFRIEGEVYKPAYFVWQNNQATPVSIDRYAGKNLTFVSSDVVQIPTGETIPQSGRMFLPTKNDKASYPLVIYIPENIYLPYNNKFNPTVQHLCQSGYAVFVWNTRFAFRPKIGFAYSDLLGTFPEDVALVLAFLQKEYSTIPQNTFLIGEGLGGYLALNASSKGNESFIGVAVNQLNFPGKEFGQDINAARMFGEDAQSKYATLDRIELSPECNYLSYQTTKSNLEIRLTNSIKQNKIKWTEHTSENFQSVNVTAKELDEIAIWMQRFSHIETKVIENKPKVEVKKK